jgi:ABC-type metal ion transport system substrate-binding protein
MTATKSMWSSSSAQRSKDLADVYRSAEFKAVVDSKFQGYAKPSFLQ